MPSEGIELSPASHLLSTNEIIEVARLFVSEGVTKIRLTGGEPTVRKDVVELVRRLGELRSLGLKEIAITSNGVSLLRKLPAMVEAGLTAVNLSLDTLIPAKFELITRRRGLEKVLQSMDEALRLGVRVKVNTVVMRGVNEEELGDFVEMTKDKEVEVRFIEYMPFDVSGVSIFFMISPSDGSDEMDGIEWNTFWEFVMTFPDLFLLKTHKLMILGKQMGLQKDVSIPTNAKYNNPPTSRFLLTTPTTKRHRKNLRNPRLRRNRRFHNLHDRELLRNL